MKICPVPGFKHTMSLRSSEEPDGRGYSIDNALKAVEHNPYANEQSIGLARGLIEEAKHPKNWGKIFDGPLQRQLIAQTIAKACSTIDEFHPQEIQGIYLVGSRANGSFKRGISDFDVLLVLSDFVEGRQPFFMPDRRGLGGIVHMVRIPESTFRNPKHEIERNLVQGPRIDLYTPSQPIIIRNVSELTGLLETRCKQINQINGVRRRIQNIRERLLR